MGIWVENNFLELKNMYFLLKTTCKYLGLLRYIWETKIFGMILIIHMTLLALYGLVMGVY